MGHYAQPPALQTGELPRPLPIRHAKAIENSGLTGGDAIANLPRGGIMSHLKVIVPAAILLGGFLVSTTAFGKQEYMKATKKPCAYCHLKVVADKDEMNKNLTAAGKYYHEHKSLDGYQEK